MVEITQTCDACAEVTRKLSAKSVLTDGLRTVSESSGWRQIHGKWVCPPCIARLFTKK